MSWMSLLNIIWSCVLLSVFASLISVDVGRNATTRLCALDWAYSIVIICAVNHEGMNSKRMTSSCVKSILFAKNNVVITDLLVFICDTFQFRCENRLKSDHVNVCCHNCAHCKSYFCLEQAITFRTCEHDHGGRRSCREVFYAL